MRRVTLQLIMSIPNTWRRVFVKKQIEKIERLCQKKDIEKSARIIDSIWMPALKELDEWRNIADRYLLGLGDIHQ